VTAQLVDESEDVRNLQEELRRRDQELEQVRRDQANIAIGQVVDVDDDSIDEDNDKFCLCASKRNVTIAVISVALVLVGIIVAVVVAPTTKSTPQSDSSTASPTASPTSALPGLIELLSSVSFDDGEALQTPSTPQNDAVLWLANNTNLGIYSDQKKIQRYVLATLYYSTNGNNWRFNNGWMSDLDECGWWNDADDGPFCYNGSVVKLDFFHRDSASGNNLVGTIPNELALLSASVGKLSVIFTVYYESVSHQWFACRSDPFWR
jgi:energy-converting hydrogenase Eha subunit A